jgi:hypothetical protein
MMKSFTWLFFVLFSLLQATDIYACRIGIVQGVPEYSQLNISSRLFMASLPNDPSNCVVITFKDNSLLDCMAKGNTHFMVLRRGNMVHSSFEPTSGYFPAIPGDQVFALVTTFPCDADQAKDIIFDTGYPQAGTDIFQFEIEFLEPPTTVTLRDITNRPSLKRKRDSKQVTGV